MSYQEPIAIIGSGLRFSGGADTPSKLWDLIQKPRDLARRVPPSRYDVAAFYHENAEHHGTSDVQESYFLDEDITAFDNGFFNIQPGEAEALDPQQRMLMETVYDSLCAAGQTIEGLRGSPTAVYVGMMCSDWAGLISTDQESLPQYAAVGMGRSIMANRISWFFDWHGPSITIDTACSSSLVAVHLAIQNLRSGESQVAIAAGANLILTPAMYIAESKLHMLSPSARCRMWDIGADGYARGEGIAAVVLKPLSKAIEDGDFIECIIRATGINQDGRTPGLTMPSATAQAALIRSTYARAGLDICKPEDRPQYFHAHGTGTPVGDLQEAQGICRAFDMDGKTVDKLYVGSIKTIVGHTEGAAGLASLISTSLALRHGAIPPNLHFDNLNPQLAPFYKNLEIPTGLTRWPKLLPGQTRRASINSFGFGGTNMHVIVEAYPSMPPQESTDPLFSPLTISAASPKSLRSLLLSYSSYLKSMSQVSLHNIAYSLQKRQSTLPYRAAVTASTREDAIEKIDNLIANDKQSDLSTRYFNTPKPKILGIFTGQGAQWPRMGARLIELSPFIATRIAEFDQFLAELPRTARPVWTLREQLLADESTSRIAEAAISQPLCTAVQIVLVDLLRVAGVTLHAVIGHSSGEIGAAYAAGLLSAKTAIQVAYFRGQCAKFAGSMDGSKGAMVAVGISFEDASKFCNLESFKGRIQIAAHSSSTSVTLSGDQDAISEASKTFEDEGKFVRRLKVDTAYHSFHMRACAAPYLESLNKCGVDVTSMDGPTWYSSVHGGKVMSSDDLSHRYWVDNMTNGVLFAPAVASAATQEGSFDVVLEIGPHPALKTSCLDTLEGILGSRIPYSGVLSRHKDDVSIFSDALGFLWKHLGAGAITFDTFEQRVSGSSSIRRLVPDLPKYPFDHSRSFWSLSRVSGAYQNTHDRPHPILGKRCRDRETSQDVEWRNIFSPKEITWLKGHRLQGQIVFPATGYVALAVEAMNVLASDSEISLIAIEDLVISQAVAFSDEESSIETLFKTKRIRGRNDEYRIEFSFYSGTLHNDGSPMALKASGVLSATLTEASPDTLPIIHSDSFNMKEIEVGRFYDSLARVGYHYSWPFCGIKTIERKRGLSTGIIENQCGYEWADQLHVHPCLLDAALQTCFAAFCCPGDESLWGLHVPTSLKSVVINPFFAPSNTINNNGMFSYEATITDHRDAKVVAELNLYSEDREHTFIQIEGMEMVPFPPAVPEHDAILFSRFEYQVDRPDGELAAASDDAAPDTTSNEIQTAIDLERIALYYLRNIVETVTLQEKADTLIHYQHLLKWAESAIQGIHAGQNPFIPKNYLQDTHEKVDNLLNKYRERVDVRLIKAVGENLPQVIRTRSNILEYMIKDSMLENYYESAFGLGIANRYIAQMIGQLAHRYPRMNILEIGAGTGGSTAGILHSLGSDFSSYTYTDISSGFFAKAQDRFKRFTNRMIFKTFDMERGSTSQDIIEGSYDLVVASNVLHATALLEKTMANVRRLLKPGGYLIALETVSNNCLQVGLTMGSLPGWWVGIQSGRSDGPTLTLPQWQTLLRKSGFSGIDTHSPSLHELHPCHAFSAQAVDERVDILRSPLSAPVKLLANKVPQLIIIGGETGLSHQVSEQITGLSPLDSRTIIRISSIEALNSQGMAESSTVLSLTELDKPLLQDVSSEKLDALKTLWRQAGTILWVTQRARTDQPYSFMTFGLGRAMKLEYPNINLQILDIDRFHDQTHIILAEALLRLEILGSWSKQVPPNELFWSLEPEIHIENGNTVIPRLYPVDVANERYNTSRRAITEDVDPKEKRIILGSDGPFWKFQKTSPLRQTAAPRTANDISLRVSYFLLQTIRVRSAGTMMLCVGVDTSSGERMLVVTDLAESPAIISSQCAVPLGEADPARSLALLAANITADNILKLVTQDDALIVHEPDPLLGGELVRVAKNTGTTLVLTTSLKNNSGVGWTYIHRNLPVRLVKRMLPQAPLVFVNLSQASGSAEIGELVRNSISQTSAVFDASYFFGTTTELYSGAYSDQISKTLLEFWPTCREALQDQSLELSVPIIMADEISSHPVIGGPFAVVDCSAPSISATLHAIDEGIIFRADKTYLLVGLSGEVGQSICQWMVEHGARYVVLTSRQPKVHPKFISTLKGLGATIKVLPLDITKRESLNECYNEISHSMPPVAGVANGAMVLEDSLFENMSTETFTKVLEPKVTGSQLLDELFHDAPLDFFVAFSSITVIVGNSGQSNYIAANMFMTALMAQRKKRGLAGSVIDIGPLIGLGYIERSDAIDENYFTKRGYRNISEHDLHQLFAEAILVGQPGCLESSELAFGLAPMYADNSFNAHHQTDVKFNHFIMERLDIHAATGNHAMESIRMQLSKAETKPDAALMMKESFTRRLRRILMLSPEDVVDERVSLIDLGVDSLMAVDVRSWFLKELDVSIPVIKILDGSSIADLLVEAMAQLPASIVDISSLPGEDLVQTCPSKASPPPLVESKSEQQLDSAEGIFDRDSSLSESSGPKTPPAELDGSMPRDFSKLKTHSNISETNDLSMSSKETGQ